MCKLFWEKSSKNKDTEEGIARKNKHYTLHTPTYTLLQFVNNKNVAYCKTLLSRSYWTRIWELYHSCTCVTTTVTNPIKSLMTFLCVDKEILIPIQYKQMYFSKKKQFITGQGHFKVTKISLCWMIHWISCSHIEFFVCCFCINNFFF